MSVFVNYYPCSYGESLLNMFGNFSVQRKNEIIKVSDWRFKRQEFYGLDPAQQKSILIDLDQPFYACHRQNRFVFEGHVTVSIILDVIDFLPKRYQHVHMPTVDCILSNKKLLPLVGKIPIEKIIIKDYNTWAESNIFKDDLKIMFSWIIDKNLFLEEFCHSNNFFYDQTRVDEIKQDFLRWC